MTRRKRMRTLAKISTSNVVATNQHPRIRKDALPDNLVQQHHSSEEQNITGMQQPPATPVSGTFRFADFHRPLPLRGLMHDTDSDASPDEHELTEEDRAVTDHFIERTCPNRSD